MAEIVLDKLTKRYPDGALAVSEVDIQIADGEFIILVGPSGCGKSTMLNMIAGLEDISSGELRIDGQRVNERAPKDRDIAMVFQSYALYPHMSVRENMAFPLRLAKVADATVRAKVDEAAQILDLTQHLERKPANLFVAGFIGSPAMNFMPGTLENGRLSTGLGEVTLSDRVRRLAEAAKAPREVIAGIRPEHFEDARVLDDTTLAAGSTFNATVDVLESMGSDKFVYFTVEGEAATSAELEELAADAGSADVPASGSQLVTRLSAASNAKEGTEVEVWFDADKIQLFDPASGKNLTYSE
ncbi:MAG: ATP-binding cassette domain-containing protein [Pseudonocardiaceae bacterium]|nr:ATP-binding cassette domain-containing protein [Pseudonocardiaceae bacterium]